MCRLAAQGDPDSESMACVVPRSISSYRQGGTERLGNDGVAQTSGTRQDYVIEMRLSGWPFRLPFLKNPFRSAPAGRIEWHGLWRLHPPI